MIWTAASSPAPSATVLNTNDSSMTETAASQVRHRARPRISRSRNSSRAGSSRVAFRFSTFDAAFAVAAASAAT